MSEKPISPLGLSIIELSNEAADLGTKMFKATDNQTVRFADLANLRSQRASAEEVLNYTVAEMRIELFANAPTRATKKGAADAALEEAANPAAPAVITATTKEEREAQFEHYLAKLRRTQPNHPYTQAYNIVAQITFQEEEIQQNIKDTERKLSAMRTVADLTTARLLALSRVLGN